MLALRYKGTTLVPVEIEGLTPVDSADFDVIRDLRTNLADLLE